MALETPQHQRILLICLAVFSTLLLLGMGYLLYNSLEHPATTAPSTSFSKRDSTRIKLAKKATQSAGSLPDLHQRSTQNVTKYEKAVNAYDSNRVELP